jgi:hypothetical protein
MASRADGVIRLHAPHPHPPLHSIFVVSGSPHSLPSTNAPRWQMPQDSQDLAQGAQSNQNFLRLANGGSPGAGSGTARALVGPWQAGQGGGVGVASIPLIREYHDS